MNWKFKNALELLSSSSHYKLLGESLHGVERECLRITEKGHLSHSAHPKTLGSALTNPYITTDFSEAQLELITPPFNFEQAPINFLQDLHVFINKNLKDEMIWPLSMPCALPKEANIPIAQYGNSQKGKKKTLYREGLSHRYGRKMQTVSGTHYNFSFSDNFWKLLQKKYAPKSDFQTFKNDSYLKMIRNFLRYSWLNTYLFGAAPAIDKSYCDKKPSYLKRYGWNTYYGPYATSLRMSNLGYYSKVQAQLAVSFNSLEEYLRDMEYALNTPVEAYHNKPGLNSNILQIENEHYSRIRPKALLQEDETPVAALERGGISYIEVRAVDINPYWPTGLQRNQLRFLHIFLIYCLLKDSPSFTPDCKKILTSNQNKVAIYGRDPKLKISDKKGEVHMLTYAEKLLKEMKPVAQLLDKFCPECGYSASLNFQLEKLKDVNLTASQQILNEMFERKESLQQFGLRLSRQHHEFFQKTKLNKKIEQSFKAIAEKSLEDQKIVELRSEFILDDYKDLELSTQLLMRQAWKRGINVEVLDRSANFLRLTKGKKVEYIRQATKTRLDTYVDVEIMGNKFVHKKLLSEAGINVPKGKLFGSLKQALKAYSELQNLQLVVKPTTTNYGIGIHFVKAQDFAAYEEAIKEAFGYDSSVIAEQYIPGNEYRFLVMGGKCVSVLERVPANVIGDGKHSVHQLIDLKNEDPYSYKPKIYYIRKGEEEKAKLAQQKLTLNSIPKKGQQVFLRDNSNVSTGGDPIDVSDKIAENFKQIAIKAAKVANATFCGIDMIIKGSNYAIIEINYNPALQMHEFPYKGQAVPASSMVLDLLGF